MLDRKTPPPFVHTTSFELLKPSTQTLSNGVEVFFIPGGEQDVIKIELIFKAGRWYENVLGASHFTANLLNKGTASKNSFQIAQVFDRFGAHLEINPGLDFISVAVYALNRHLSPVVALLMELISAPIFPEKELDQAKSIFIQNLKVNEEKTSFLAGKAFKRKLFGDNHPYGVELEERNVSTLLRRELENHYQALFAPPLVFVSGKVSDETQDLIIQQLSAFREKKQPVGEPKQSVNQSFHERIEKEGSIQSSIRVGKKSIQRSHKNYPYAIFATHILGGYFGSRLMKNIREEKGLTYGIYASIHSLLNESYFVIGADVNKENVSLTIDEIKKELRILRTEKVSKEELLTAKNHFIGSLQSEITTPFAHADKLKTIHLSGLDSNYYQQLILAIDKITPEKVMETSEGFFHEDSLNEVAVG